MLKTMVKWIYNKNITEIGTAHLKRKDATLLIFELNNIATVNIPIGIGDVFELTGKHLDLTRS
ncbi:MAG: hypothetical protein ACI9RU_001841 [Litorivivens sp.]|jgi:hypothetical protein